MGNGSKSAKTTRSNHRPSRSKKLTRDVQFERHSSDCLEQIESRSRLRDELALDLSANARVRELTRCFVRHGHLSALLHAALNAAIEVTRADFGNIQLMDPAGTLRIVVQQGFCPSFLEYFDEVHDGKAACGTPIRMRQRVLVEDVTQSPIFQDARTIEVLLDAGVRSVQSTPLISRGDELLGMLSTHYRVPGRPSDRELRVLDVIARLTGDFIEWKARNPIHEARAGMEAQSRRDRTNYSTRRDPTGFSTKPWREFLSSVQGMRQHFEE